MKKGDSDRIERLGRLPTRIYDMPFPTKTRLLLFLVLLAGLIGCARAPDQAGELTTPTPTGTSDKQEAQIPKNVLPRKIIYTGNATLITENLDRVVTRLETKIKEVGGYIGSEQRKGAVGNSREAAWTIRIPSDNFDKFMKSLTYLGELQNVSRQAQDVSEEFYDVQARLKNKRVEEERLIQLLAHRTGQLQDVLTVEKELSRVREEIERVEGRLRYLANQTDLSTVTLTIEEIKGYVPEGSPTLKTKVGRSFGGSVDALKEFATGLLLFFVALIPWLIPIGLLAWVVLRVFKPRKRLAE